MINVDSGAIWDYKWGNFEQQAGQFGIVGQIWTTGWKFWTVGQLGTKRYWSLRHIRTPFQSTDFSQNWVGAIYRVKKFKPYQRR